MNYNWRDFLMNIYNANNKRKKVAEKKRKE